MDTTSVLLIALIVVAIAACVVGVFALLEAIKTSRSTRAFVDRLDERVIPLLEKVDVTVDAVNAELLRVDGIVTQLEEVSETVSSTTSSVRSVVAAPAEMVNGFATGLRRFLIDFRRAK